jgi:hypothetical protein
MEAKLATKYVKVLRGSIELPLLDAEGNQKDWPQKIIIREGELCDLEEGLADKLASLGIVEVLPST